MSLPKISRKMFMQASVVITGAALVGCETEGPAGADAGPRRDSGPGPRRDSGLVASDSGPARDAGGGGTDAGGGGDAGANLCSGASIAAVIFDNHSPGPHELIIPVADILAGTEKTYVTGGTTSHCHSVTITAANVATLRSGGVVRLESCTGTDHEYALSCGAAPTAMEPVCADGTVGGSDDCTGTTHSP